MSSTARAGAASFDLDLEECARTLADCRTPTLVGVRHHSPACAAVMPGLLRAADPTKLLIELPPDFDPWLPWLSDPDTEAPVALAGGRPGREDLCFYPFADFSPELAALRWARKHKRQVVAIDLPIAGMARAEESLRNQRWRPFSDDERPPGRSLIDELLRRAGADDTEELWDRLVEVRAAGAEPEAVRRAALLSGFALRLDAALGEGIHGEDLARETRMRACIEEHTRKGQRLCAVVGAFHAAALLAKPLLFRETAPGNGADERGAKSKSAGDVVTSLIPYAAELLDSRSGYPAGIRDPLWQQRALQVLSGQGSLEEITAEVATSVCRELRQRGHAAGLPDAQEAVRLARDLANLRGLPGPGRRELLEGITAALAQGQLLGRGRALATALQSVLVGSQRGRLADGTPRSGLASHLRALLAELGLPGPDEDEEGRPEKRKGGARKREPARSSGSRDEQTRLRLDPLRSQLDRRRHVALHRLAVCGIPYATLEESDLDQETLTVVWRIEWSPSTEAAVELAGTRGVTLAQAAAGALAAEERRLEESDGLTPAARLDLLQAAAECGLREQALRSLAELGGAFLQGAGLSDLVSAHTLVERIDAGHMAGLPRTVSASPNRPDDVQPLGQELGSLRRELLAACVRALDGVAGSEELADARSLIELVHLFEGQTPGVEEIGAAALLAALLRLSRDGSPLMQGAAGAALCAAGKISPAEFGTTLGSFIDLAAESEEGRAALAGRLAGALLLLAPLLEASTSLLEPLAARIEGIEDSAFLRCLPSAREGFEVLSPASRGRLLEVMADRLGSAAAALSGVGDVGPLLARFAAADLAGRGAVEQGLGTWPQNPAPPSTTGSAATEATLAASTPSSDTLHQITAIDRWRLLLGQERERLGGEQALRMARALDELYGTGRGEGSRSDLGAGQEGSFPTAREWSEELQALFGEPLREEVLGRAVAAGRTEALMELDVEQVTPSVELLEQALSLKGALPEAHLSRLRRLVERCVTELTRELASRIRPALAGLTTPRPSRRPRGPLDLRRTVQANLETVRLTERGEPQLRPERLRFLTRAHRSVDWHLLLLVDVSGSMEPSTIYSALLAAILAGIPALSVRFIAFSTEVVDLSERVTDPLGLLLEVKVGGGTHIAKALRYAREQIQVPSRTLLLLVSDFDEGFGVSGLLGEVRHLVDSGVKTLGVAALDDRGKPRYNAGVASAVVDAGMPVAALTPLELARWVAEKIR